MSPPDKPWERISQANSWTKNFAEESPAGHSSCFDGRFAANADPSNQPMSSQLPAAPPPLPPRPYDNQLTGLNRFGAGSYSYPFSSPYCNNFYGGGLNSFGLGSYGYNRFGYGSGYYGNYGGQPESDFIRVAEESSRHAFHSIESLVQAFSSVSMMLESTYFAVHSSFRAVIGVADQFSRLKNHLQHILSTLALLRTFRWIIRKLLYLVGRRNGQEEAWDDATSKPASFGLSLNRDGTFDANRQDEHLNRSTSSWPILIFFGVVLGTPWLIWRLLSTLAGTDRIASDKWSTGEDEHYEAKAIYDFSSDSPRELSFVSGQRIVVAPKDLQPRVRGWLLASDGKKSGLIPSNYVRILGLRKPKTNAGQKNN